MTIIRGKAWVFGDSIDTDVLAPGTYLKAPIEEMAKHCLEAIDASFASHVAAGDIVVAGRRNTRCVRNMGHLIGRRGQRHILG